MMTGKTVLVTGGTGSFGSRFVPWLLEQPVAKVIVFSRDEYKQWLMARQIKDPRIRWFLGDVRDKERLIHAMQQVDICVHAAALKQVSALEYNPQEAYRTNVMGTSNVIDAVVDSPCWRAILLSTDKACEPANLYGATKLVAERLWIASNVLKPVFSFVRYGNVMESRGGVLGIWRELMDRGEMLPLTDHRMTRFWMTFEAAIAAVRTAIETPPGLGVIQKSRCFHLVDLVAAFGIKYDKEVTSIVSGRGAGEKLHETLITSYEGERCRDAGQAFVLPPEQPFQDDLLYPPWEHVSEGFRYCSDGPGMTPSEIALLL